MFRIEDGRLVSCKEEVSGRIVVPDTVTTIRARAFVYEDRLTGIEVSPSVRTIGDAAFGGCTALEEVVFSDGLKRLGNACFINCTSLRSIRMPDTMVSMHADAFRGCVQLADVHLSKALRRNIESRTFEGCAALESITIPSGIQQIKSCAFKGCTALRHVTFENPDIWIESDAFSGCTQLDEETAAFIDAHFWDTAATNISSRASGAAGRLSNYTERSFEFDGVRCGSLEGVLQSFKCPDPEKQAEISALVGGWAKQAGMRYDWKAEQLLYWQGRTYPRRSEAYQQLLDRLYLAVYEQDEGFRNDLAEIRGKRIDHRMGLSNPSETVLTRFEFITRLRKLSEGDFRK